MKKLYVFLPAASLTCIITLALYALQVKSANYEFISPLPQASLTPQITQKKENTTSEISIKAAVEKALEGTTGTYAVFVKDLETGATYTRDEKRIFEAGSLYKLWIMAEVLRKIDEGTLNENDMLSGDIKNLNEKFKIATESAELTEGTVSMTVKEALSEMITVSHNYAALLLSAKVRLSNVSKFMEKEGFNNSKLGQPPVTTAAETAMFLEKIYKKQLVSPISSEYMLELLKKQEKNHKIPKYLPKNIIFAHKTGEIGEFSHDAGIIYTENGDYIIVIMSQSTNPAAADIRIANVSQAIYSVFTNEQNN